MATLAATTTARPTPAAATSGHRPRPGWIASSSSISSSVTAERSHACQRQDSQDKAGRYREHAADHGEGHDRDPAGDSPAEDDDAAVQLDSPGYQDSEPEQGGQVEDVR